MTTIRDMIMSPKATNDTRMMVPLLAGNLPFSIQCWLWKYRLYPRHRIKMLMARNVAPSGFPTCFSVRRCWLSSGEPLPPDMDVFRRNSCVMAMPMEAKASDVRSQARNVRSGGTR